MTPPDNDKTPDTLDIARMELAQLTDAEKLVLINTVDTDEADLAALITLAEWYDSSGDFDDLSRAEMAEIFAHWRAQS